LHQVTSPGSGTARRTLLFVGCYTTKTAFLFGTPGFGIHSDGCHSHFHIALYISLAIHHTKQTSLGMVRWK
jgi:hypothetical protein